MDSIIRPGRSWLQWFEKKDSTGRLVETFSKIDFLKKFRPERLIEQDA